MTAPKTARWLDLIAYLLQHRMPVTRGDIFEKVHGYLERSERADETALESARRKFERDKDELRALGLEIETVPLPDAPGHEPNMGYRLREGRLYLPYLELTTTEAPTERPYRKLARLQVSPEDVALLDRATRRIAERTELPLAAAAGSLRRKLEFDLPLPIHAIERVLAHPIDRETQSTLSLLQRAVAEHVAVRCRYYTIGRDAEEEREIEPYGLFFNWSRWYCVARARDRDALRVFRLDRMSGATLIKGKAGHFEVPEDFSIGEYVGRAPWELSEASPSLVRVQFAFPESRWVQAQRLGTAIDPLRDDGGAVIEFGVRDMSPFLRWLLTFRRQAEVIDPDEVRGQLEALRRQVRALYK
jgi:predicted DNA-binding transcriptional regulator YafY